MIHPSRRLSNFWASTLVCLACSATALAGNAQQDAARAAARTSGYEGIQAFESGNMAVAVDKLGRAFNVVKVPTLGLWYARALAKTGNLVEASERYGEVMRLEITEGKVKEQKQAQAEAAEELTALQPKIPTLTLTVQGASAGCEVSLDGNPLSMSLLGMATPVNPGTHRIQAKQGTQRVEQSVTIHVGDKKSLELKLVASDTSEPAAAKTPAVSEAPSTRGTVSQPPISKGSPQKAIGWITLGVGGVATVTGVVTGLLGMSKRSQLDDSHNCEGTVCRSAERDLMASYNQMRTISTVGFIVGVVGIGAGTTLLLTAPKPREATMSAWLGVGSLGVRGTF